MRSSARVPRRPPRTAMHPFLPRFEDRPFLALLTLVDPTGVERAFDDRYFMASSELNLLNTLLFVGEITH